MQGPQTPAGPWARQHAHEPPEGERGRVQILGLSCSPTQSSSLDWAATFSVATFTGGSASKDEDADEDEEE